MAKSRRKRVDTEQLSRYLGPLELRIMTDVWEHGPSTVNDVLTRLNESGVNKLVYNTVMTTLARLADKGYLDRRREGRAFVYFGDGPEVFLRTQAAATTRDLVDGLGQVGVAGILDGLPTDKKTQALLREMLNDQA